MEKGVKTERKYVEEAEELTRTEERQTEREQQGTYVRKRSRKLCLKSVGEISFRKQKEGCLMGINY